MGSCLWLKRRDSILKTLLHSCRSAPRQRNEASGYGSTYPGDVATRGQSYSVQQGQAGSAPGGAYGAGGMDSQAQAWAPAPREAAYGGAPHTTGIQ